MITLDGLTAESFGFFLRADYERPASPETEDRTVAIPGMDGLYDFGADLKERRFNLPIMWRKQTSDGALQTKVRELMAFLTDDNGKPRTIALSFDDDPTRYFNVRYSGKIDIARMYRTGEFNLPLVAFDPFAYANVTNNEITWGSEEITFYSDYLMGHEGGETRTITGATTFNVVSSGFITQRPTFTLAGTGAGVTFAMNGKSFTLSNLDGGNWTVDGGGYRVIKNGVNGMATFSGDFLDVVNGDNAITITGTGVNFTLQITFRDKYV